MSNFDHPDSMRAYLDVRERERRAEWLDDYLAQEAAKDRAAQLAVPLDTARWLVKVGTSAFMLDVSSRVMLAEHLPGYQRAGLRLLAALDNGDPFHFEDTARARALIQRGAEQLRQRGVDAERIDRAAAHLHGLLPAR